MGFRRICDDTSSMGNLEMAHNCVFIKNGEAWYRDFEREVPLRTLVSEILTKYAGEQYDTDFDPESFDEAMCENLQYGTEEIEGVIALFYQIAWGAAELREWLKVYEETGLPTTMRPEILQQAVDTYGSEAQVDMAIEEMSELSKALLKHRRAERSPEAWDYEKTRQNILEEMADVIIMLTQLMMICGDRERIQDDINFKVERLDKRLKNGAKEAGRDAAQEVLQPAT